ncbi:HMG domain-containing protein 4 isoform X2 [Pantherophis guttatus]|uniref:HMG domain-containing protein 4 isoform X2 n=1 Tax=Pantherophis guttatus TaxID=94885 RepID=A0ABM3ZQ67_PANGU|nr:HMG domain-containing protein 4 isoform X2 [Pantherophis guttatus]
MDLLKAINTPLTTGSKSSKRTLEKPSHSSFSAANYSEGKKEHHKKKLSGSSDPPLDDSTFHKSKKIKPPYVNTEMLTLREPDGLKMKLILSPKEKGGTVTEDPFPHSGATKKTSKKSSRDEQSSQPSSHDTHSFLKSRKKHKPPTDPHPLSPAEGFSPDTSLFPEGQSSDFELSNLEPQMESESSSGDSLNEKKKKKEEKEKIEKIEKEKPKKKNMSAYQVFCKEYRVNIVAEHPGIDFGELSKKLAEVWKQLPEKDKLVWKQKAQYLQHKQNKAEATTVKRKAMSSEGSPKLKASLTSVPSPHKKSPTSTMVLSSSPVKVPETDPIDVAAHLQLLGESLSLIGHRLQETEGMVAVSGSLSVLLDSIICALGPLTCLTSQLPELNGCPKHVLSNTLDNIAYIMPGL